METVAEQDRKVGGLSESRSLWDAGASLDLCRIDERAPEQIRHQLHGHNVEHDRAQNLVDAVVGLQGTGNPSPQRTAEDACDEYGGNHDDRRHLRQIESRHRCEETAENHLALGADVDDARTESDNDAGSDEQKRGGLEEGRDQCVTRTERTDEHLGVALEWVGAEQDEHDRPEQEGCEDGEDGDAVCEIAALLVAEVDAHLAFT